MTIWRLVLLHNYSLHLTLKISKMAQSITKWSQIYILYKVEHPALPPWPALSPGTKSGGGTSQPGNSVHQRRCNICASAATSSSSSPMAGGEAGGSCLVTQAHTSPPPTGWHTYHLCSSFHPPYLDGRDPIPFFSARTHSWPTLCLLQHSTPYFASLSSPHPNGFILLLWCRHSLNIQD